MTSGKRDFHPQITLASSEIRKDERDLAIVIKPVAGRSGEYLAYCRSAYLDATFAVYFKDTLMGGLALHSFIGMVERKYKDQSVRVLVSEEELLFKNEALLDVLTDRQTDKRERRAV